MKTNIKLRVTPEQSKAVQEICFKNGVDWDGTGKFYHINEPFIYIYELSISYDNKESSKYFSNHENKEVDADLFIRTNGTCEESVELVNNLLNNKSREDMFKRYGFEVPNFDCTILTKVEDKYIGYVTTNQGDVYPTYWFANGCRHIDEGNQWNLTPIKQPWYETCKYPVLVWEGDGNNDLLAIETRGEYASSYLEMCKPLSNNEIDQLKQDF